MTGFVGFRGKVEFFDRKSVRRYMSRETRRFLAKFGAFVRRRARSSIKPAGKRNKISEPGSPPRSHTKALKRNIFFGFEFARETVVVGPVIVGGTAGAIALEALEEGGSTIVTVGGKKKRTRIEARPFMLPAFEAEKENISQIWKSS